MNTTLPPIRISSKLKSDFTLKAEEVGVTVSELIRNLLQDYLNNNCIYNVTQLEKEIKELEQTLKERKANYKKVKSEFNSNKGLRKFKEIERYRLNFFKELSNITELRKVEFTDLKIKENKYPEIKEELIKTKARLESNGRRTKRLF